MNRRRSKRCKGIGLFELFVALGICSALLIATPGLKAYYNRLRLTDGLRTVTSAFHTARYQAVYKNKRVKVLLEGKRILLQEKVNRKWQTFHYFEPEKHVTISMNRSPVFSPFGTVAPLCTTTVAYGKYNYKVTISMAGRIKVTELP